MGLIDEMINPNRTRSETESSLLPLIEIKWLEVEDPLLVRVENKKKINQLFSQFLVANYFILFLEDFNSQKIKIFPKF